MVPALYAYVGVSCLLPDYFISKLPDSYYIKTVVWQGLSCGAFLQCDAVIKNACACVYFSIRNFSSRIRDNEFSILRIDAEVGDLSVLYARALL